MVKINPQINKELDIMMTFWKSNILLLQFYFNIHQHFRMLKRKMLRHDTDSLSTGRHWIWYIWVLAQLDQKNFVGLSVPKVNTFVGIISTVSLDDVQKPLTQAKPNDQTHEMQ